MTFIEELKRRKVVHWSVAYLAGSWVLLQVIALLAEPFGWPEAQVVRSATVLLAILFMAVLIISWNHGQGGRQRVRALEMALVTVVLASAAAGSMLAWRNEPGNTAARGAAAAPRSIAVLPFDDMSPAKDQEYFTDGITEEILNVLAGIDGLRVAARTSSFAFKNLDLDVREIGRRLDVAHIVEGSIQKSGERVRVTAQLIDARNGYHLWSGRWDKALTDVFAIEDEIAAGIAEVLRTKLALEPVTPRQRQPVDAAVHDLYLRGVALTRQSGEGQLREAIALFEQALARAPEYADAHAAIAFAYTNLADAYVAPREAYSRAQVAARRAVQLDSTNALGLAALGYTALAIDRDPRRALALLDSAVRHNPNSVEALFLASNLNCGLGSTEGALAMLAKARQLDPYSVPLLWGEEVCLVIGEKYDAAIEVHNRLRQLAPDFAYVDDMAAVAWRAKNDLPRALAEYQHVAPGPARTYGEAITYARMGRKTEARERLRDLERIASKQYVPPSAIAAIYGQLGDLDTALQWLDKADQAGDLLAYFLVGLPDFAPLAQNPRTAARIKAFVPGM